MVLALLKFGYKKVDEMITKYISSIKTLVDGLKWQKTEMKANIRRLTQNIEEARISTDKTIDSAKKEARLITAKATTEIGDIVLKKQMEHWAAVKKIKAGLSMTLQGKVIALVVDGIAKKLKETKSDRDFHDKNIDTSMKMLEDLIEHENN
jgi:F0F1-type ATP synthase membrane subunit b/b'